MRARCLGYARHDVLFRSSAVSFYVYILTNPVRTVLYTGVTNDLERRLYEHSSGLGEAGKFTGRYQCNLLALYPTIFQVQKRGSPTFGVPTPPKTRSAP